MWSQPAASGLGDGGSPGTAANDIQYPTWRYVFYWVEKGSFERIHDFTLFDPTTCEARYLIHACDGDAKERIMEAQSNQLRGFIISMIDCVSINYICARL